jgi:type II secretory pathway pseudopilin PulG
MSALSNIAVIGILAILAIAAMGTLTGLDRRLDERRNRRARDRFDIFTDGEWR